MYGLYPCLNTPIRISVFYVEHVCVCVCVCVCLFKAMQQTCELVLMLYLVFLGLALTPEQKPVLDPRSTPAQLRVREFKKGGCSCTPRGLRGAAGTGEAQTMSRVALG